MPRYDCVLLEATGTGAERIIQQDNPTGVSVSENKMLCCGARFLIFKKRILCCS